MKYTLFRLNFWSESILEDYRKLYKESLREAKKLQKGEKKPRKKEKTKRFRRSQEEIALGLSAEESKIRRALANFEEEGTLKDECEEVDK